MCLKLLFLSYVNKYLDDLQQNQQNPLFFPFDSESSVALLVDIGCPIVSLMSPIFARMSCHVSVNKFELLKFKKCLQINIHLNSLKVAEIVLDVKANYYKENRVRKHVDGLSKATG